MATGDLGSGTWHGWSKLFMSCTCHWGSKAVRLEVGPVGMASSWALGFILSRGLRDLAHELSSLIFMTFLPITPFWFQPVHFPLDWCINGSFCRTLVMFFLGCLWTRGTPKWKCCEEPAVPPGTPPEMEHMGGLLFGMSRLMTVAGFLAFTKGRCARNLGSSSSP